MSKHTEVNYVNVNLNVNKDFTKMYGSICRPKYPFISYSSMWAAVSMSACSSNSLYYLPINFVLYYCFDLINGTNDIKKKEGERERDKARVQ